MPDRFRLHVVVAPGPNGSSNVIVPQAGLGAGGILQRAGATAPSPAAPGPGGYIHYR